MIQSLRNYFNMQVSRLGPRSAPVEAEHTLRLAAAALLVEMTRADFSVDETERTAVLQALESAFELDPEETRTLFEMAEQEATTATSLHDFTRVINERFSAHKKLHLIELLWRVAYADGVIDKYEDHLVRKVAALIYVPHADFVRAKHAAEAHAG